jgi:hypothetical protein
VLRYDRADTQIGIDPIHYRLIIWSKGRLDFTIAEDPPALRQLADRSRSPANQVRKVERCPNPLRVAMLPAWLFISATFQHLSAGQKPNFGQEA